MNGLSFGFLVNMLNILAQDPTPLDPELSIQVQNVATKTDKTTSEVSGSDNPEDENYILDTVSGCLVFNPFPKSVARIEWTGGCKDGYSYGEGMVTWHNVGGGYEQETSVVFHENGKYTGPLTSDLFDEDLDLAYKFDGHVVDNYNNGLGVLEGAEGSYQEGFKYEGNFKDGFMSGFGILTLDIQTRSSEIAHYKNIGAGSINGSSYVVTGLFKNDSFVKECNNAEDCLKENNVENSHNTN